MVSRRGLYHNHVDGDLMLAKIRERQQDQTPVQASIGPVFALEYYIYTLFTIIACTLLRSALLLSFLLPFSLANRCTWPFDIKIQCKAKTRRLPVVAKLILLSLSAIFSLAVFFSVDEPSGYSLNDVHSPDEPMKRIFHISSFRGQKRCEGFIRLYHPSIGCLLWKQPSSNVSRF